MDLQTRVTRILSAPKEEWPVIAAEQTDVPTLYGGYIAILAAIPPLSSFLGMTFIGVTLPVLGTYRFSLAHGVAGAIVQYALGLVGVYIAAYVIARLAPNFQSQPDVVQALKLVAYASTATWIASILTILPALSPLMILAGLYGLYLAYLGMPPVMKTPQDKVVPYMVVSAVVIIAVTAIMGIVTSSITGAMFAGPRLGA
jgi:hypothetical protein